MAPFHHFKLLFLLLSIMTPGYAFDNNIGNMYLGKTYISDPLGEETAPDYNPLIRDDAFDCVTFVETSLAKGDITKLNQIRYANGQPNFLLRNHFIESDWINNNFDLVKNVSSIYGKTAIRFIDIDKQNWFLKRHNIKTNIPLQSINLEYLPYKNIKSIDNKNTLIVLFIVGKQKNIDIIGSDLAVVHMGFLLPGGVLRHASSTEGYVLDTDFKTYISKRAKRKNDIGIILLEITNDNY